MKEIIKTQLFNLGGHSGNKKNTGKSGKLLFANMFDKTILAENNRQGNVRKTGTKDNLLKMNVDFLKPANSFDMDKVNETFTQSPAPLLVNSQAGNFNDIEPAKKVNDLQTKTQLPEDSGLISPDFKSFNRSLLEFLRVNNNKGVHFSKSEQTELPSKKAAAVLYAVQKIAQAHIFSGLNKKENTNYKIEGEIQGRIEVRLNNKTAGNRINIVVNSASAQRELQKYMPFIKQSLNENGLNGASLKLNVIHLPEGNAHHNNSAGSQPPVRSSGGSAVGLKDLESNNLKKLEIRGVDSIESKPMVSVDKSVKHYNKNVSDVQQLVNSKLKTGISEKGEKYSEVKTSAKQSEPGNLGSYIKILDKNNKQAFNFKHADVSVTGEVKSNFKDTNPEIKTTGTEQVKKQSVDGKSVKDAGTKNFNAQIKTADTDSGKTLNAKQVDASVKGEVKSNLKDTNPEIKTTGTEQVKKQSVDGKVVKDSGTKNFNSQIKTADTDGGKVFNAKQADTAVKGEVKSNLKNTNSEIKTTGAEQVKKQSVDGKVVKDSGTKNFNSQIKTTDTDGGKAHNAKQADTAVKGEVKSNLKNTNPEIKTTGAEQVKKQSSDGKVVKDSGTKNFNAQIKTTDIDGGKAFNSKQADVSVKGEVKSNPKNINFEIKTTGAEQVKKQSVDGKVVKDSGTKNFNSQIKTADTDGGKAHNAKQADTAVKGEVKSNLKDTNPEIKTIGTEQVKKQSVDGKSVKDTGAKNFNAQIKTADTDGGKVFNAKQADTAVKGEVKSNLKDTNPEIKTIGTEQVKKQSVDGKVVKDSGTKNFNSQIKTADTDGGKVFNAKQADTAVKGEVKSNLKDTNPEIKTTGTEQVKKQSGDGKVVKDSGTKNFNSQIKTADTDGGKAHNAKQADVSVKSEVKPNLNNSSLLQDLQRYGKNHIKLDGNNHWQSAFADKMGNNSTNSKRVAEKRNEIFEMKTIKSEAQESDVSLKPGRLNKVKKSVLDGRLRTSDLAGSKKVLETGIGNIQKNSPSMIEKNGFLEFSGKSLSAMQDLTLNADEPLKQGVEIKQLDTGKIMHNWLANQPVESVVPGKFAPLISNVQRVIQMQYVSNLGKQINANFKIDGSPLGEMEIKFNGDNHGGVVTVYVESESARSELQKLLPIINDGLVQKGIDLADIKIDLGNFARENSQDQKMNGNNKNPLTNKLQEDANEQIIPAMTAKSYGYNTIEVLA